MLVSKVSFNRGLTPKFGNSENERSFVSQAGAVADSERPSLLYRPETRKLLEDELIKRQKAYDALSAKLLTTTDPKQKLKLGKSFEGAEANLTRIKSLLEKTSPERMAKLSLIDLLKDVQIKFAKSDVNKKRQAVKDAIDKYSSQMEAAKAKYQKAMRYNNDGEARKLALLIGQKRAAIQLLKAPIPEQYVQEKPMQSMLAMVIENRDKVREAYDEVLKQYPNGNGSISADYKGKLRLVQDALDSLNEVVDAEKLKIDLFNAEKTLSDLEKARYPEVKYSIGERVPEQSKKVAKTPQAIATETKASAEATAKETASVPQSSAAETAKDAAGTVKEEGKTAQTAEKTAGTASAKEKIAETAKDAAGAVKEESKTAQTAEKTAEKAAEKAVSKLSTGAKIGIGAGIVLLIGIIAKLMSDKSKEEQD